MGGMPPLGYDVKDRKFVINEAEVRTVIEIYRSYLTLKSVHALRDELAEAGITSKRRLPLPSIGAPPPNLLATSRRSCASGCLGLTRWSWELACLIGLL